MGQNEQRALEILVIRHNAQTKITYELAQQLESHLPIASFEQLIEKVDYVVVDSHSLPLKVFAPHVSDDLFPIESIEDLVQTLSVGVRSALSLAQVPSFPVTNPLLHEILATTRHEPGKRSGIPVAFGGKG